MKMGWKPGSGLGTSQSGIVEPIQVQIRQKGIGVGLGPPTVTSITQEERSGLPRSGSSTDPEQSSVRKKKKYKSVKEIVIKSSGPPKAPEKVVDFTGNASQSKYVPELLYNIALIVDKLEQNITVHSKAVKAAESSSFEGDFQEMMIVVEEEKIELENVMNVVELFGNMKKKLESSKLDERFGVMKESLLWIRNINVDHLDSIIVSLIASEVSSLHFGELSR